MTCRPTTYLLLLLGLCAACNPKQEFAQEAPFPGEYVIHKQTGLLVDGQRQFVMAADYKAAFPDYTGEIPYPAILRDMVLLRNGGFNAVRFPWDSHASHILKACREMKMWAIPVLEGPVNTVIRQLREIPDPTGVLFANLSFAQEPTSEEWDQINRLRQNQESLSALIFGSEQKGTGPEVRTLSSDRLQGDSSLLQDSAVLFITGVGPQTKVGLADRDAMWNQVRSYIRWMNESRAQQILGVSIPAFADAERRGGMGVVSACRIPKYAWHFFRSQMSPTEVLPAPAEGGPMVYAVTDWLPQSRLTIPVFTNTGKVSIFLNERLQVSHEPVQVPGNEHLIYPPVAFSINEFEAGLLWTVGYIDHRPVAYYEVFTPAEAHHLYVSPELQGIPWADGESDLFFVSAQLVDREGTALPDDGSHVTFSLKGGGEIIGPATVPTAFGKASIMVKTHGGGGPLYIEATCPGLEKGQYTLGKTPWLQGSDPDLPFF